jgi:hypothetical protein
LRRFVTPIHAAQVSLNAKKAGAWPALFAL